jgi:hypothetical protein
MMKRFGCITATVALVTWLSGAALAQAPLGFSINPTQGIRGSTVNGQVNTNDVTANCVTDLATFQQRFEDLFNGPFEGGSEFGDLPERFFPDPNNLVYENTDQMAYVMTLLAVLGITADINMATEDAFPQTFVMTFADFAQNPLGTLGHFDPVTGVGSVEVPDITPGMYPVAAVCVGPSFDLDALEAGMRKTGAYFTSIGMQFGTDGPFSQEFLDWAADYLNSSNTGFDLLLEIAAALGPTAIQNIAEFDALGIQLFTITTPTLGFTIDPTQGFPGDTVNGQVDTADIDQYCVTDLGEFQAQFEALFEGPYAFGGPEGAFFDAFFPSGDFEFVNHNQTAYSLTGFAVLGIGADIGGAVATAFPQTFVMTFADLLTQQPLGPLGHFDPFTGVGSVVVPDLAPGPYPVAATCVRPTMDLNLLIAGIEANGAYLESIGAPTDINSPEFEQFAKDFTGDPDADLFTFIFAIGPQLIQNIVEIRALGVQFYTVLSDVNHFQCYRARTTGFNQMPVTLADRFGMRSATVRKPLDLCAPADKNGEDPEAADSPFFLTSYKISGGGRFEQISPVHADNQFGPVALKIKGPSTLLVPTEVSLVGPPSSAAGAFLNHFTCYKARALSPPNSPAPGVITVQTAFETVQVQPKKPKRLCVPVHKNGGPILAAEHENLLCYKAKSSGRLIPAPTVFLNNQFGQQTQRLGPRREICIPTDLLE